jgi:hypothetical protein
MSLPRCGRGPLGDSNPERREVAFAKREKDVLLALHLRAVNLLYRCSICTSVNLGNQIKPPPPECTLDQLIVLHSRALDLLSRCSHSVMENLKDEIECIAEDTGRSTLMPVRVQRVNGTVVIDPYNIAG